MTKDHDSDEWLMRQVGDGRQDCLASLVRRYATPLLTFIQRMIVDRHRSEEIFQDAFLAVWTGRKSYGYPRPFKPWLFRIAVNACYANLRRSRPVSIALDGLSRDMPTAGGIGPLETMVAAETAVLVAQAISELPPQQRAAVVLRVWNCMSYAEIADVVECSEATARSHMHHGLAALRRYLEPRLLDAEGM